MRHGEREAIKLKRKSKNFQCILPREINIKLHRKEI
jgi:hypothetical protein